MSGTTTGPETNITFHHMWEEILQNLVKIISNHVTSMIPRDLNLSGIFQGLLGQILEEGTILCTQCQLSNTR